MALTMPRASQINFDITNITDPLIRINSGETGSADKDTGIVIERGSDQNVALIYDESADTFALINTDEIGTTAGNVTIASYADLTLKKVTQSEQQYTTSNMMKFNQYYLGNASGSYFTNGEYQKVLTIIPAGNSENYQVRGTISAQNAGETHVVTFNAALRSGDPLPDLSWSIQYTEQYNGSRYIDPQLWTKETSTAGFIFAFKTLGTIYGNVTVDIDVIPRSSSQKSNVTMNNTVSSEQAGVDSGYTANDMTKVFSIIADDLTVAGTLTANVTGNASGTAATVTGAAQTNITSLGTLTALQVDNININGNAITSTAGTDLTISPLSGQQIVLDGTIVIDAGVVTGATSITSTAFVGDITGDVTGNTSGTAATVTTAAQTNITSLGTLTTLTVDNIIINGTNIGHTSDTDSIAIASDGVVTFSQAPALGTNKITGVGDPTASQDAATKAYVDSEISSNAVTTTGTATLTNKSLTAPIITGSSSAAGSILFKEDTDNGTNAVTLIGPASTADATVTLPAATDTLVGKATTDTLTNKTLTSPALTTPTVTTSITLNAQADLKFADADSSHYVAFQAPNTVASNVLWTLPGADGTEDQVLSTNGSGTLAWSDGGSGGSSSGSSFPNSTISTMPSSAGDYDLQKNAAQDTAETPFESGGSDAFGVNLGTVYSMMDPAGTTTTVDLGTLS